ncbi:uncharacterized protein OCT59_022101 [Rhizophagus irregularis]|uniref:uncharacterized protein n=1 Tax=Rhizophagus irregularis TaxID=588596 RepID=UPI0033185464|nr:hypothetical protein OCT59_022101 [Rhizophagus irregularis]
MIQNRKNKNTEKVRPISNKLLKELPPQFTERAQTTNINKSSSNIQQAVEGTATPIHEQAQTTNINKNSSIFRQPSLVYQTNEPTRDDDDASTENRRLSQEVSDLRAKCLQLERRNNELTKHTAVVATEIARLREDNEFLAGVNAEFGSENDDLKEEVNELKTKLE